MNTKMLKMSMIALSALVLVACGGGTADYSESPKQVAAFDATVEAHFHQNPMELLDPSNPDADGSETSATMAPMQYTVPQRLRNISRKGLTPHKMAELADQNMLSGGVDDPSYALDSEVEAQATTVKPYTVTVYKPAQIRAAYKMPAIPTGPGTTSQRASLGGGQTIYIIIAYSNPNIVRDLAAFNAAYGLPTCRTVAIPVTSVLPLAQAKIDDGCTLSVVNVSSSFGNLTTLVPAYSAGWQSESTMDVQWSHVAAPMARIVLIQAQSASTTAMASAVALANKMGPGVVSMSFGAKEGPYATAHDNTFKTPGMTYVASTGDFGTQANWPAVVPTVVSVGGTSLSYGSTTSTTRVESAWSGSGGAVSSMYARPSFQNGIKIGGVAPIRRAAADVSLVANPSTGAYVMMTPVGSTSVRTYGMGGTSLSAPLWAGMIASMNGPRALLAKPNLGARMHEFLYTNLASRAGNYMGTFGDVKTGSNGTCTGCTATTGYDIPTGLGTPHLSTMMIFSNSY